MSEGMFAVTAGLVAVVMLIGIAGLRGKRRIHRVDVESAKKLLTGADVVCIDVRSPGEFRSGHIEGARLVPLPELRSRIGEIAEFKDRTVLVYCRAGHRSKSACDILQQNGFTKVCSIDGGLDAWTVCRFPIVK